VLYKDVYGNRNQPGAMALKQGDQIVYVLLPFLENYRKSPNL
jgi:hypothetical protein